VLSRLVAILCNPNTYKLFLSHRGPHAQNLLDLVQDLLDLPCDHKSRPLLSKALVRLSRASGLHPTCFSLSGLQKVGDQVAAGGFGDIWKGLVEGHRVAVKVMRIFRDVDVKAALKEFGREAVIWRQLSHPNLLPFLGLYFLGSRLCLVSPWMEGGDLVRYLKDAPADTDRIALILDIATGLEYLHSVSVVHGDLKGTNILVTPSRRACIADFGLSSIVSVMSIRFTHSTANAPKGTLRWQAPELLSGKDVNHFGSDVYAFGCVCYEILSGNLPFNHLNEAAIMYAVLINKDRPRQPTPWPKTAVYNGIWALLEDCWNHDPRARPSAREIVQRLVAPPIGAKLTRATTDWDESYSSIFRRCVQQWRLLPSTTEIESRILETTPRAVQTRTLLLVR
ncbi:kinase-like domain-containing protein, partial [Mycena galericulata]